MKKFVMMAALGLLCLPDGAKGKDPASAQNNPPRVGARAWIYEGSDASKIQILTPASSEQWIYGKPEPVGPGSNESPSAVITKILYDASGVVTGAVPSDGTPGLTFEVDRMGRRVGMKQDGIVCRRGLDIAGTLTNLHYSGTGIPEYSVSYMFATGTDWIVASVLSTSNRGRRLDVNYDPSWQVTSLTIDKVSVQYTYEARRVSSWTVACEGTENRVSVLLDRPSFSDSVTGLLWKVNGAMAASYQYECLPSSPKTARVRLAEGTYWEYTYKEPNVVTATLMDSAGRAPVPGMQFAYTYHGDCFSAVDSPGPDGRMATSLRVDVASRVFRCSRTNYVSILGLTDLGPETDITVNGQPCRRSGRFFHGCAPFAGGRGSGVLDVVIQAKRKRKIVATVQGYVDARPREETITYSPGGRRTSDGRFAYTFNSINQMSRADGIGQGEGYRLDFSYYPDGPRATKTVSVRRNGRWILLRTHQYLYGQWGLVLERIINSEGSGEVIEREYYWGLDLAGWATGAFGFQAGGVGGLVAVEERSKGSRRLYVPVFDRNGNVSHLVDLATGKSAASYTYDPYGSVIGVSGEAAGNCPFRFQTQYYDEETGLICFRARYYDPVTGKWLSPPAGGTVQAMDPFCDNDPINNVTPFGSAAGR